MAVLEQVATHDESFRTLRRDMRRGVAERAVRFIAALQRKGIVPATVDPRYAATALTGMVDRFAYVWLVLEEDFDEAEVVENLTTIWFQAIGGVVPTQLIVGPARVQPTTPRSTSAASSASDIPSTSRSTSVVCWPSSGAGRTGRIGVREACHGGPAHRAGAGLRVVELDEEAALVQVRRRRDLVHRAHRGRP